MSGAGCIEKEELVKPDSFFHDLPPKSRCTSRPYVRIAAFKNFWRATRDLSNTLAAGRERQPFVAPPATLS